MPNESKDINEVISEINLKQDIELINLSTENIKLKLKIENEEQAYMSLLRDYTELEQENEKLRKKNKQLVDIITKLL